MIQKKEIDQPMPPTGCWIRYQLNLRGMILETAAKKAGRSVTLVSRVISGERRSEKVQAVLAEMLGYKSWQHLWAAAMLNAERRAV
jgi:hypothetical protein